MDSITDRITRSLAQRGFWGTLSMCAVIAGWKVLPRFREKERSWREADLEFDRTYGVDTGGVFRPKKEEVIGDNWALGGNYQSISPSDFESAMARVAVPYEDFVFVDMGSGKGKSVLMASMRPFKKAIGVEYCPKLNEVARKNVANFPAEHRRCGEVEIVDGDAAKVPIPNEPLLLFLNNPFAEPVMIPVVQNVVDSYKANPRRIVIIYFWPNHADLWEKTGLFQRIHDAPAIFDTHPDGKS